MRKIFTVLKLVSAAVGLYALNVVTTAASVFIASFITGGFVFAALAIVSSQSGGYIPDFSYLQSVAIAFILTLTSLAGANGSANLKLDR